MEDRKIHQAWFSLRLVLGVVPVATGLDKLFSPVANWEQHLSPLARRLASV
ncbi:MAG: hypothetical protein ABJA82_18830 [Myxococcales bacterium]